MAQQDETTRAATGPTVRKSDPAELQTFLDDLRGRQGAMQVQALAQQDDTTTPQQQRIHTGAIDPSEPQAHFLGYHSELTGTLLPGAPLGYHKLKHCVYVYNDRTSKPFNASGDVVLSIRGRGFDLHEYLPPDEARALADALNHAADHEEAQQQARHAADWLASQEDATTEQVAA
jgi:hypothetical protein